MSDEEDSVNFTHQATVECDSCMKDEDVLSFCLNCMANICEECKITHTEDRLHRNHRILPRSHPAVRKARTRASSDQFCKQHPGNEYVTYCRRCRSPCCSICITDNHSKHEFCPIEDMCRQAKEEVTHYLQTLEGDLLPIAQKGKTRLHERIEQLERRKQESKEKVEKRISKLKKKLLKMQKEMNSDIDRKCELEEKALKETMALLEENEETIQSYIENCRDLLTKESRSLRIVLFNDDRPNIDSLQLPGLILPSIHAMKIPSFELPSTKQLLGEFSASGDAEVLYEPTDTNIGNEGEPTVVSEETLKRSGTRSDTRVEQTISCDVLPSCLVTSDKNEIWVADDKSLVLFNDKGEKKKERQIKFSVYDIARLTSRDILATDQANKRVVKISDRGKISTIMDTEPFLPYGVHVTSEDEIVVGLQLQDREPPIKLSMFPYHDLDQIKEIEDSITDGQPLFRHFVHRVIQNGNGDLIVVDDDRVVSVSVHSELRWIHEGSDIRDVVSDSVCNIIVGDIGRKEINLLDSRGRLLRNILGGGTVIPLSLSVDNTCRLWIGQKNCEIIILTYLKHVRDTCRTASSRQRKSLDQNFE